MFLWHWKSCVCLNDVDIDSEKILLKPNLLLPRPSISSLWKNPSPPLRPPMQPWPPIPNQPPPARYAPPWKQPPLWPWSPSDGRGDRAPPHSIQMSGTSGKSALQGLSPGNAEGCGILCCSRDVLSRKVIWNIFKKGYIKWKSDLHVDGAVKEESVLSADSKVLDAAKLCPSSLKPYLGRHSAGQNDSVWNKTYEKWFFVIFFSCKPSLRMAFKVSSDKGRILSIYL